MTRWYLFISLPTQNVPVMFFWKILVGKNLVNYWPPLMTQVINPLVILELLSSQPRSCSNPELLLFASELIELPSSEEGILDWNDCQKTWCDDQSEQWLWNKMLSSKAIIKCHDITRIRGCGGKNEWPWGFIAGKILWGEKGHFTSADIDLSQWDKLFDPSELITQSLALLLVD